MRAKTRVMAMCSTAVLTGLLGAMAGSALADTTGMDKAASADGKIPAYAGPQASPVDWSYGKVRGDFWKHKGEKPLYSIDASNVDKYADRLTPGQIQLVKQKKGYRMDVYQTHRECGAPDFVQANMEKNATQAKLDAAGESLETAALPGMPFPAPKNGAEAMWDHLARYRGVGMEWQKAITGASPRPGSSEWILAESKQTVFFPWGKKGVTTPQQAGILYGIYFAYQTPAALAGQGLVQRDFFDKSSDTFYYFTGQRRVRRMPSYSYDAPQIGFENQYTVDEPWLFNGTLDRFSWKLVGKKEIYVPYNDFGMFNFKAKFDDIYKADGVTPDARRYELHRVYVVEATVKPGVRHVASKKVFYIDEDSGIALAGEDYDAQGKLWKVKEAYLIPVYELHGACDIEPFVQYDLSNGRYVIDQSTIGTNTDIRWYDDVNDPRFKDDFYTSESLRSVSER
ncbi:DUF1329 domain-containing protein [Paraburkholderia saeva]|uniref:DUF1329 domain-containing protein n=1 Tax=Paraburkholderia saeva TaxID=2777537 RepID=A0A9N8X318_9BURK|nr:hypothetical protein R52603_03394 [Paraburkholderia saeva]CAG4910106.1 hypothetical protein LMG31841_03936 [Paraburkholderia saeva]